MSLEAIYGAFLVQLFCPEQGYLEQVAQDYA